MSNIQQAVCEYLQNKAGIPEKKSVSQKSFANSFFKRGSPTLRVAGYFDVTPDIFVVCVETGTLGLVYFVTERAETSHRWLQEAAHLKELLLSDACRENRTPYAVEVVLVVEHSAAAGIGAVLQETVSKSSILYGIGVNVVKYSGDSRDEEEKEEELKRGFAWLMVGVREWFAQTAKTESGWKTVGLELANYRVHKDRRSLDLDSRKLHIVHGQNGSGKSSFVEAAEWLATGKIERLGNNATEYPQHIANDANQPLDVACRSANNATPYSLDFPPDQAGVAVAGFRLNQKLMDRLAEEGDEKRAEVFLSAFFSAERPVVDAYHQAGSDYDTARNVLPGALSGNVPTLEDLAGGGRIEDSKWVGVNDEGFRFGEDDVKDLFPYSLERLTVLAPELSSFAAVLKYPLSAQDAEEFFRLYDAALKRIRNDAASTKTAIDKATTVFGKIKAWRVISRAKDVKEPGAWLHDWLETQALIEMMTARRDMALAWETAGDKVDWQFLEDVQDEAKRQPLRQIADTLDLPGDEVTKLDKSRGSLQEEAKTLLDGFFSSLKGGQQTGGTDDTLDMSVFRVSTEEVSALNKVGKWYLTIQGATANVGLGDALHKALLSSEFEYFGELCIGDDAWRQKLLPVLQTVKDYLDDLDKLAQNDTASGRLKSIRNFVAKRTALQAAGEAMSRNFLLQIGQTDSESPTAARLHAALAELMTIMTPARWAYPGLRIVPKSERGEDGKIRHSMALTPKDQPDVKADLRLNSAELNVFSLSLFLLCAPLAKNPLNLILLDDPLQNMDELTTTYVARGIARLANFWPIEQQKLVLFFHGVDALEQFAHEMGSMAACYKLGWLGLSGANSPTQSTVPEVFTPYNEMADPSAWFQPLTDVEFVSLSP